MHSRTRSLFAAAVAAFVFISVAPSHGLERPFIVGGMVSQPGAWPWQVVLYEADDSGALQPMCGGSLIAPTWVLTAAHCFFTGPEGGPVSPIPHERFSVGLGVHDTTQQEPSAQVIAQARILLHEGYNPNPPESAGDAGNDNDVALIQLATPATLNDRVQTVPLMLASQEGQYLTSGTIATVAGWGDTFSMSNQGSPVLKEVTLPIVSDAACRQAGYETITPRMFCAGGHPDGGQDTCQGDSGGPLVVRGPSGWVQAGIVSFGQGCAEPGVPGVYARVSSFIDWINQRTGGSQPNPTPTPGPMPTPTPPASSGSGLQTTADGVLTLVNKPIGAAQWAITQHEDGSVTGNVFYTDGTEPDFLDCARLRDDGNPDPAEVMITYSCALAKRCTANPCPAPGDWTDIGEATLKGSFFLPRAATSGSASGRAASGAGEGTVSGGVPSQGSGLQATVDGNLVLVNKPVGAAQWAITENSDGSVTGNIFYTNGNDPEFVDCVRLGDDGNPDLAARMIRYSCSLAARCTTAQCPAGNDWMGIGEASLPGSFFLPRTDG